jgi:hypothetical protein
MHRILPVTHRTQKLLKSASTFRQTVPGASRGEGGVLVRVRVTGRRGRRSARGAGRRGRGGGCAVAHRCRLLVLSTGTCFVRRDPSANPSYRGDLVTIEGFVRYKARFGMIRNHNDIIRIIGEFAGWPIEGACLGPRDPRVLPLHTFDNNTEWPDLDQPEQVTEFAKRFGSPTRRTDPAGRSWVQSAAFHGGDALFVAGYELNPGFHWDVERGRGRERIFTTHEVWKLTNQNSYCNIYPDGYVRQGRTLSGGSCRLVWSAA